MSNGELTLLSKKEIWGENDIGQLDVLKKYGSKCAITDLGILTGGFVVDNDFYFLVPDDKSLKGRTASYYTRSSDSDGDAITASLHGD